MATKDTAATEGVMGDTERDMEAKEGDMEATEGDTGDMERNMVATAVIMVAI